MLTSTCRHLPNFLTVERNCTASHAFSKIRNMFSPVTTGWLSSRPRSRKDEAATRQRTRKRRTQRGKRPRMTHSKSYTRSRNILKYIILPYLFYFIYLFL